MDSKIITKNLLRSRTCQNCAHSAQDNDICYDTIVKPLPKENTCERFHPVPNSWAVAEKAAIDDIVVKQVLAIIGKDV